MEHPLRSISYIGNGPLILIVPVIPSRYSHICPYNHDFSTIKKADIGDILVLIAKRKDVEESELHRPVSETGKPQQRVVCHVLQVVFLHICSSIITTKLVS
jgi:hypothetical protein